MIDLAMRGVIVNGSNKNKRVLVGRLVFERMISPGVMAGQNVFQTIFSPIRDGNRFITD
jgi:hypothetical protein